MDGVSLGFSRSKLPFPFADLLSILQISFKEDFGTQGKS